MCTLLVEYRYKSKAVLVGGRHGGIYHVGYADNEDEVRQAIYSCGYSIVREHTLMQYVYREGRKIPEKALGKWFIVKEKPCAEYSNEEWRTDVAQLEACLTQKLRKKKEYVRPHARKPIQKKPGIEREAEEEERNLVLESIRNYIRELIDRLIFKLVG